MKWVTFVIVTLLILAIFRQKAVDAIFFIVKNLLILPLADFVKAHGVLFKHLAPKEMIFYDVAETRPTDETNA